MGLEVYALDNEHSFHIGYIGFTQMRQFFVLSLYGWGLYEDYRKLSKYMTESFINCKNDNLCPIDVDSFSTSLGDLDILIGHSDCDGRLTVEECCKLKPVLKIDKELIHETIVYENNPEYVDRLIQKMKEFKQLVDYSIQEDVELIFA